LVSATILLVILMLAAHLGAAPQQHNDGTPDPWGNRGRA